MLHFVFESAILNININSDFVFEIAVTVTTILLLQQLVETAACKKAKDAAHLTEQTPAPILKRTQLLCGYFVFIVLIIAIFTFIFTPEMHYGFLSAISVLMIACPCAITAAIQIAILSGIGCIEKSGILINNATCLERLEKVTMLIVDEASTTGQSTLLALKLLQEQGIHIVLVTRDNFTAAKNIADNLGIVTIETETSPQQKYEIAKRLQQQGFVVAITTNNTNNTGMSLEVDTDIDNKNSSIRIAKNDLLEIVRAHQLSKKVMSKIRQNLFFTFMYNLICIPLAAGAFYFWTGLVFNPILAAILMFSCSILIMINALRLQNMNFTTLQY